MRAFVQRKVRQCAWLGGSHWDSEFLVVLLWSGFVLCGKCLSVLGRVQTELEARDFLEGATCKNILAGTVLIVPVCQ